MVGVVASQVVPVSFANDAAERTNELSLGGVDKVFSGVDSSGVKPYLHPPIDSAELGEFEVAEPMDKVLLLENHEPIWFFQIGGKFSQEGIGGNAYGSGDIFSHLFAEGEFHTFCQFGGNGGRCFGGEQPEAHFVDATNLVNR